jgi:outer membrane biosynthesis protein TonB
VADINALRTSKGLAPLTPDPALAATACTWNDQMIAAGTISHDPNLAAAIAAAAPDWRKGGENVGMGGTVSSLFDAFVASPGHYKNLVDPDFSRVGVCVGRDANDKLFTTHRFLGVKAATPPPTTAAALAPTTPPPTAAPPTAPTTAAPTTAAPTTAAPTAPPPTPAPTTPPPPKPAPKPAPTTAAPTSAAPASAPVPASLGAATVPPSSTTPAGSPDPTDAVEVRELVVQILDAFPAFLHLRLP